MELPMTDLHRDAMTPDPLVRQVEAEMSKLRKFAGPLACYSMQSDVREMVRRFLAELQQLRADLAALQEEQKWLRTERNGQELRAKQAEANLAAAQQKVFNLESHLVAMQSSDSERTVKSLATMLGWGNVPPQETLERDLNALKARAKEAEAASTALREHLAALVASWQERLAMDSIESADSELVLHRCANELAAALASTPDPSPAQPEGHEDGPSRVDKGTLLERTGSTASEKR